MHDFTLETERLFLRPLNVDDAKAAFAWTSDPEVNRFMNYVRHTDVEQTREWLRTVEAAEGDYLVFAFVRKSDGLLIGSGGTYPKREGVWNVGYNLRRDCWRQGFAAEGMKAVIALAHEEFGARAFIADHAIDNPASGRVMEKCGMRFHHFGEYEKWDGSVVFPAKYYRMELDGLGNSLPVETEDALESGDLLLRKPRMEDWKAMYRNVWSRPETARHMLWKLSASEEDAKARIERTIAWQREHDGWFVIEKASGQAIGFAGMTEAAPGIYEDTGIALGPDYVGKGYGKQVLRLLMVCAAYGRQGRKFICSTRSQNEASKGMIRSCGLAYTHSEPRTDPRDGSAYECEFYERDL